MAHRFGARENVLARMGGPHADPAQEYMTTHRSMDFFEAQFRRQVGGPDCAALNPFEILALPYLEGDVLDLGCGLGNLSLEAARRGHRVIALDASATAIARIRAEAEAQRLPLEAREVDLATWTLEGTFDTVVSIGLLMFLARERALSLLSQMQTAVRPGGRAIVNVLVQGTTYLEMFDPQSHYLFEPDELARRFGRWELLVSRQDTFPAPGDTLKQFSTVVAVKPAATAGTGRARDSRSGG